MASKKFTLSPTVTCNEKPEGMARYQARRDNVSLPLMPFNVTLVCNDKGQMCPAGFHQDCTDCSWCFGPLFHADLLQSCDVSGLSLGNIDFLYLFFLHLTRPLRNFEMLSM